MTGGSYSYLRSTDMRCTRYKRGAFLGTSGVPIRGHPVLNAIRIASRFSYALLCLVAVCGLIVGCQQKQLSISFYGKQFVKQCPCGKKGRILYAVLWYRIGDGSLSWLCWRMFLVCMALQWEQSKFVQKVTENMYILRNFFTFVGQYLRTFYINVCSWGIFMRVFQN